MYEEDTGDTGDLSTQRKCHCSVWLYPNSINVEVSKSETILASKYETMDSNEIIDVGGRYQGSLLYLKTEKQEIYQLKENLNAACGCIQESCIGH